MKLEINRIHLPFPFNVSQLYSHLLKTESGYYLVDTGHSSSRGKLLAELEKHGCTPANLRLILLTHGDFDHVGNAVYLQQVWGVNIMMHALDAGMLERGEAFHNRMEAGRLSKPLLKRVVLTKKTDHSRADIFVDDGMSLAKHGLDAVAYHTPGHSSGSISLLTASGDFFCGDLLINSTGKPRLNFLLFDRRAAQASLNKLKNQPIRTVYPAHGAPFAWDEFIKST